MKYSVKHLAKMYEDYLLEKQFDVTMPNANFDISAYNDYRYRKMMTNFDKLYHYSDTIHLTEQFLKGD